MTTNRAGQVRGTPLDTRMATMPGIEIHGPMIPRRPRTPRCSVPCRRVTRSSSTRTATSATSASRDARAVITSARFYNFYNWGGLKGDPREMLARYFDLFVHTGNARPDRGMLRFPAGSVDLGLWRRYVTVQSGDRRTDSAASITAAKDSLILEIAPAEDTVLLAVRSGDREDAEDEWGDEEDDDGYDDERYDDEDYDDEWYYDGSRGDDWYGDNEMAMDEASWPVSLALVRSALLAGDVRPLYLLWLLSVQRGERRPSALEPPYPPDDAPLTGWLYLFAEFLQLNPDLLAVALDARAAEPRTAAQLLTAARDRRAEREREEAERAAAARRKRLAALEKRQEAEWAEIDQLLDAPKVLATTYRDVIDRLTQLRELADDRGEEASFQERLSALLERFGRKPTLRRHVREARLLRGGANR